MRMKDEFAAFYKGNSIFFISKEMLCFMAVSLSMLGESVKRIASDALEHLA